MQSRVWTAAAWNQELDSDLSIDRGTLAIAPPTLNRATPPHPFDPSPVRQYNNRSREQRTLIEDDEFDPSSLQTCEELPGGWPAPLIFLFRTESLHRPIQAGHHHVRSSGE